ncbi:KGK domain-containing protein [Nostoc sp. UIC 10630]|uniref:KGK domain-containing protein n=1 Tax=Nostoc sp. UIC 10630 TaxID=2100146 RepID=UPI0013D23602|nr:KGK domain-containing protein [Nostoc sp. UIC 10630]NEU80855.1 KGK family protein [Nostoc sp. UIC 10630]
MKNKFILLECGDDVICLEKDTFKVSKLRELVIREIVSKWRQEICTYKTKINNDLVGSLFSSISARDEFIPFSEIKLNAVKDCQVLKIDGNGWQKGKLEILIFIYPNSHKPNNVCFEFYPDEPIKIE